MIKNNSINEKEREKIQATEKLCKEMLYKIKETKANLLALNDEQLQTTTRLTILQNHQLTTELEYQSKQTEQLLYKNSKMKTQIDTMKRDIQIHKEVEKELAKRSHFCQKVIKRLKQQVKDLQSEKTENRPHIMGGQTQRKSNGGNANMQPTTKLMRISSTSWSISWRRLRKSCNALRVSTSCSSQTTLSSRTR